MMMMKMIMIKMINMNIFMMETIMMMSMLMMLVIVPAHIAAFFDQSSTPCLPTRHSPTFHLDSIWIAICTYKSSIHLILACWRRLSSAESHFHFDCPSFSCSCSHHRTSKSQDFLKLITSSLFLRSWGFSLATNHIITFTSNLSKARFLLLFSWKDTHEGVNIFLDAPFKFKGLGVCECGWVGIQYIFSHSWEFIS